MTYEFLLPITFDTRIGKWVSTLKGKPCSEHVLQFLYYYVFIDFQTIHPGSECLAANMAVIYCSRPAQKKLKKSV